MANINTLVVKLEDLEKIDVTKVLNKACLMVSNDAKTLCPVDTGALRRSITYDVENDTGTVGTNVEYAPYVEFGTGLFASAGDGRKTPWRYQDASGQWYTTKGQQPQPFLGPALDMNKDKIIDLFKEEIKEALK